MITVDRLPPEIRQSTRAVVWRYELRDGKPKPTKVPYRPRHPDRRASPTGPATWGTFAEALAVVNAGKADGAGIVLGNGLVGVDLDDCRDSRTGAVAPDALAIIRALNSYTEVSPSGTGVHVLVRGTLPPIGQRKGKIEMYAERRYFTITGEHLPGTLATIEERRAELAALHARVFGTNGHGQRQAPRRAPGAVDRDDARLLERARAARNGARFDALLRGDTSAHGGDDSAADLALCNFLAYWTQGDAARVDRLFRRSGLWRPKWDERRGGQTYGERTITTAITGCAERAS